MQKKPLVRYVASLLIGLSLSVTHAAWAASFTIDFESLPMLSTTDQNQSLTDANGGSNTVQGVMFTSPGFRVIGDDFRIGGPAPRPAMGVAHSGHFFLNNGNTPNDDVIMTTTSVLTEAWFGRNEYYGYGGGASAVTITAFGIGGDLGSVTVNTPDTFPSTGNLPPPDDLFGNGLPDPMVQMDTSSETFNSR